MHSLNSNYIKEFVKVLFSLITLILFTNSCSHKIHVGDSIPDYHIADSLVELKYLPTNTTIKPEINGNFTAKIYKGKGFVFEPMSYGAVAFYNKSNQDTFLTVTDMNGDFKIVLSIGTYDIQTSCASLKPLRLENLVINSDNNVSLKARLGEGSMTDTISAENYFKSKK